MTFEFAKELARERSLYKVLAKEAKRVLPPVVWNYYRAGSLDETAAREALGSWNDVRFLPKALSSSLEVNTEVTLLNHVYSSPFGFAPSSLQRFAHPEGELALAQVSKDLNIPYVVSSNAGRDFREISEVNPNWWAQTYITQNRDHSLPMIEKALEAGAKALVLTVDAPVIGTKYDVGNEDWAGLDMSWHRINYAGMVGDAQRGEWAGDLRAEDISWLKDLSHLPIIVKGVLNPSSVRELENANVDAIWISNHGGRQLARAATTRQALPLIRAVKPTVPLLVDGGIYSGLDAAAALALGADAVFAGRMPLYALAAGGPELLRKATELSLKELVETVKLAGLDNVGELATVIA